MSHDRDTSRTIAGRWKPMLEEATRGGRWKMWGPFLLLIAAIAIGFAFFSVRDEIAFMREGRTATATVIRKDSDRNDNHYVVYSFQTPDGQTVQGQSEISQLKWHTVGDTMEIRYLPSDPTRSSVAGDPIKLLTGVAIPCVVGLVAAAAGMYLIIVGFRRSRQAATV